MRVDKAAWGTTATPWSLLLSPSPLRRNKAKQAKSKSISCSLPTLCMLGRGGLLGRTDGRAGGKEQLQSEPPSLPSRHARYARYSMESKQEKKRREKQENQCMHCQSVYPRPCEYEYVSRPAGVAQRPSCRISGCRCLCVLVQSSQVRSVLSGPIVSMMRLDGTNPTQRPSVGS